MTSAVIIPVNYGMHNRDTADSYDSDRGQVLFPRGKGVVKDPTNIDLSWRHLI
ncbi:MAG: hypothetical protein U0930_19500 [Pirellulales bacterium]